MKLYHCRDAGFDCKVEIRGENEDDILRLAEIHALEVHGLEINKQMHRDMKRLIREDTSSRADEVKIRR